MGGIQASQKTDGTYNPKIQIVHKSLSAYIATGVNTEFIRFRKGMSSGTITDSSIEDSLVEKDVILKIFDFHSEKEVPEMTRDLFLISFFLCGMNLADIYDCDPFTNRVDYIRKKTRDHKKEKPYLSLLIHPKAKELIDKYRDKEGKRGFCFYQKYANMPAFHQAVRRGIDVLRKELDIPNLTYYVARHSFATIARNKCGVSKDDVYLCLTHESGNSITDTYIDIDFTIVDNVINKVMDYVFEDK